MGDKGLSGFKVAVLAQEWTGGRGTCETHKSVRGSWRKSYYDRATSERDATHRFP